MVVNSEDGNVRRVCDEGSWSKQLTFGFCNGDWSAKLVDSDASTFELFFRTSALVLCAGHK